MEEYARKLEVQNKRDCWARIFSLFKELNLQRPQSKQEESTEEEEMKQQQRMATMKDLIRKIRSKGRMDAKSRWWFAELLATECEKAWTHAGWEDVVQKWYERLEYMKKKDEKQKVPQMINSAEGSPGLLHKITKPTPWRRGAQILEKEEDARLLDRCEQRGNNGQYIGNAMRKCRTCKTTPGGMRSW